jgi:hypothetical protein
MLVHKQEIKSQQDLIDRLLRERPGLESSVKEAEVKMNENTTTLRTIAHRVTPSQVQKLYKLLDKEFPERLARVLEMMIGLIRNRSFSTPTDVRLFLQDPEKLNFAMMQVHGHEVDVTNVERLEGELEKIQPHFTNQTEEDFSLNSQYVVFFDWTKQFMQVIRLAHKHHLAKEALEANQKQINEHRFAIEKEEAVLADLDDMFGYSTRRQELDAILAYRHRMTIGAQGRTQFVSQLQQQCFDYEEHFFNQINTFKSKAVQSKSRVL